MTDDERNAKFDSIKARVLDEILGTTSQDVIEPDAVEFRDTDKNWNSGKSWMSQLRYTSPMNNDMRGVGDFNKKIHDNNGVVVTIMHSKPGFDAPVVK